jgi:hypothetical protein
VVGTKLSNAVFVLVTPSRYSDLRCELFRVNVYQIKKYQHAIAERARNWRDVIALMAIHL